MEDFDFAYTPNPSAMPNLMNEHEAAERLCLAVPTLRRWRWAGKGPRFLKLGSAVRYDPADLTAYMEAARRSSTTMEMN